MTQFNLHPTLAADTFEIGQFNTCLALLMNNAALPWVILVPQRAGIRELYELNNQDQQQTFNESLFISEVLMQEFKGDKLNTAALGNMVPQLHLHHIIRYQHDPVWPNPIWGNLANKPYTAINRQQMLKKLRKVFNTCPFGFTASQHN